MTPNEINDNTHFVFNDTGVFISPNIQPVFNFLRDIEKEIESLMGFNNKLENIKENYLELLNFVLFLSSKLKDNNIDFQYTFKNPPESVAKELEFHFPLRSQMIVLFASLDVLFNLHIAYTLETDDEAHLREKTMNPDETKKFISSYILNDDNKYYLENKIRFSRINSTQLRDLRNSLTHFFSVGHGGLSLAPELLKDKSRKFENILKNNKKGNIVFMSEEDLFNLIRQANLLRLRKWSDDFKDDPEEFKKRIKWVISLVKKKGAVIVLNKNLNIKLH